MSSHLCCGRKRLPESTAQGVAQEQKAEVVGKGSMQSLPYVLQV